MEPYRPQVDRNVLGLICSQRLRRETSSLIQREHADCSRTWRGRSVARRAPMYHCCKRVTSFGNDFDAEHRRMHGNEPEEERGCRHQAKIHCSSTGGP